MTTLWQQNLESVLLEISEQSTIKEEKKHVKKSNDTPIIRNISPDQLDKCGFCLLSYYNPKSIAKCDLISCQSCVPLSGIMRYSYV